MYAFIRENIGEDLKTSVSVFRTFPNRTALVKVKSIFRKLYAFDRSLKLVRIIEVK